MIYRILVASYTSSLTWLDFDPEAATLVVRSSHEVGFHPSWIEFYPGDHSLVFTGLEQTDGKILVIKYDSEGKGSVVAEASSGGADPCSLAISKKELFVANYSSGTVAVLPITSNSPYILSDPVIAQLQGSGPNSKRQEGPHAHQVVLNDAENQLLVADLGSDCVCRFGRQDDGTWGIDGHIRYEPGSGPRHLAVHGGFIYTLLELHSTLAKHRFPAQPEKAELVAVTPTMFSPPTAPHDMLAAELLIPPPNIAFPAAYAYVSNRNDPSPSGDSIAIFDISNDKLELIAEVRTGLRHLRGMAFSGPDNKWLVAGGALGGGVKVFERVDGGKALRLISENIDIEAPTGFLWL